MEHRRLTGRVALVTGGGGEIGAAIALRLAKEGVAIVVSDLQRSQAEAVANTIRVGGGQAIAIETDISDAGSASDAVATSVNHFGKLTTLINVAAAPTYEGTVETLALADWKHALDVNLTGAFLICKYGVPALRAAGGGSIINIASQLGHLGSPGRMAYCTSKAALIFFTRMLAMDHACDNIRANSISPGAISTTRSSLRWGGDKEAAARVHGPKHLLGRPGRVDEVAAAASFLASGDASFVTAADLLVDGGYVAFKGVVDERRVPTM